MIFFFNDTATTEIYTLSLHDALPISDLRHDMLTIRRTLAPTRDAARGIADGRVDATTGALLRREVFPRAIERRLDRKSTRLNSSHANISYAVFCLKKQQTRRGLPHSP